MRSPGSLRTWVGAVVIALVAAAVVPQLPGDEKSSQGVAQWIADHRASLPASLEDLRAIPQPYRAQVMQALEPEALSRIWRQQYAELLQRDLTPAQRTVAVRMLAMITPENYRAAMRASAPEPLNRVGSLCAEADIAFAGSPYRRMLKEIGPLDTSVRLSSRNWGLVRLYLSDQVRASIRVFAGECKCNSGAGTNCKCPSAPDWLRDSCQCGDCAPAYWGCGCSGLMACVEPCNGSAND